MHKDDPLASLERKLDKAQREAARNQKPVSSASHGMRAGMDLVSGVAVGGAIGYGLDRWLETMPVFLLICLTFGTVAGIKLMMEGAAKAARAIEEEEKRNG